jgi:hypothetical protein
MKPRREKKSSQNFRVVESEKKGGQRPFRGDGDGESINYHPANLSALVECPTNKNKCRIVNKTSHSSTAQKNIHTERRKKIFSTFCPKRKIIVEYTAVVCWSQGRKMKMLGVFIEIFFSFIECESLFFVFPHSIFLVDCFKIA